MSDLKINTYPMHIGDWHSGTSRMSLAEAGAYIRLCNQYYLDQGEGWTVSECLRICAAMSRDEQKAVKAVLASKFEQGDGGYRHGGMDKRIADIQAASERNQERARIAAEKRWARDKQSSEDATSNAPSMPEGLLEECHPKAKSQKPVIDDDGDDAGATPARSDGVNSTDDLGWPSDMRDWSQRLIAETECFDAKRDQTPVNVAAMHEYRRWHDAGIAWETVVAVIREVMAKKRDGPPSTMSYFAKPISQAHANRLQALTIPEATPHERRDTNFRSAGERNQDSTIRAFGRVFDGASAGEDEPGNAA